MQPPVSVQCFTAKCHKEQLAVRKLIYMYMICIKYYDAFCFGLWEFKLCSVYFIPLQILLWVETRWGKVIYNIHPPHTANVFFMVHIEVLNSDECQAHNKKVILNTASRRISHSLNVMYVYFILILKLSLVIRTFHLLMLICVLN